MANSLLTRSDANLELFLTLGENGEMTKDALTVLQNAAEGFERFKALCEEARARIQFAGAALRDSEPGGPDTARTGRSTGTSVG